MDQQASLILAYGRKCEPASWVRAEREWGDRLCTGLTCKGSSKDGSESKEIKKAEWRECIKKLCASSEI